MTYSEIYSVAVDAAEAGAEELRARFRRGGLQVRYKGRNDVVTAADSASEEVIVDVLRQRFPDHAILAEEGGVSGGESDYRWLIDPLDGTNNYLQGLPNYCVSVACVQAGEPVVGVILDPERCDLYTAVRGEGARRNGHPIRVSEAEGLDRAFLATGYPFRASHALDLYLAAFRDLFRRVRGIRRCGAAALDLAHTAAGVYDGFFEFRLSPWDIAAGILMVREAGGSVSDLDGGRSYFSRGNVVAGCEGVWRELREVIGRHATEADLDELVPVEPERVVC